MAQFKNLINRLEYEGLEYRDVSQGDNKHVIIENDFSVIFNKNSFGYEQGKLELYNRTTEQEQGYLTAQQVLDIII